MKKFIKVSWLASLLLLLVACTTKEDEQAYLQKLHESTKGTIVFARYVEMVGLDYLNSWEESTQEEYEDVKELLTEKEKSLTEAKTFELLDEKKAEAVEAYEGIPKKEPKNQAEVSKKVKQFYEDALVFEKLSLNPAGSLSTFKAEFYDQAEKINTTLNELAVELEAQKESSQ